MLLLKTTAKQLVRIYFSIRYRGQNSIPITTGPLKGKFLPKSVALKNLSMVFGHYEPNVLRALFSIPEPMKVAYDIGAHNGYMTLAIAMHLGSDAKVFAFEPDPENIALMQQLIKQNGLQEVVQVNAVALTDVKGQEQLIKGGSSSMFLLKGALDGQDVKGCSAITVDTDTLDIFVFEELNPPPEILKIDVEGAETLVIQGGLRTLEVYSPKLLMEIHGPKNALKVWGLLKSLNYSWRHLTRNGHESVVSKQRLLSYFSKDSWTHHFLLFKEGALNSV